MSLTNDTLMVVSVQRGPTFRTSLPQALFAADTVGAVGLDYDVAADGRRFVVVQTLERPERHAVVIENWLAKAGARK